MSTGYNANEKGGRLIPLCRLKPENKRKLWTAIQEYDPAKAALFEEFNNDPDVQRFMQANGGKLCMREEDIKDYLDADTKVQSRR